MIDDLFPWDTDIDTGSDQQPKQDITLMVDQPAPIKEDSSKVMWHAMEKYHNMGLSMMWGRVDPEPERGKAAKSPIVTSWSSDIERRFTLDELSKVMLKTNPKIRIAPIIICGKGSGNLIVIDVDVKHWPGIDTLYFTAIRETYPHLWPLIRRNKTMNGGYHLLYRTVTAIEFPKKNPPLAYMKGAKQAGIESRTHGGYVLAPPGAGYTVEHDVEIPTISVEDHERLFALARLLNEEIPPAKKPYNPKTYESSYNLNPFEDFNSSPAAELILQDNGWTFDYENSQWVHYTRPDKTRGVSASYHKIKRFYHVFTSSTDLIGTNFSPAALRCHFECQDDWKKLYPILVKEGYGKHKATYEEKVIRKAVETGKPLPANFSPDAKDQLITAVETKNEKYPHGIFWEYNPSNDSYFIQRKKLLDFMKSIGLRLHKGEPVIIEPPFIRKLKEDKNENGASDVFNILLSWIKEEEEAVYLKICHEFIKCWQSAGSFSVKNLEILDKSLILRSKPGVTYKAFKNGILVITPDKMEVQPFLSNMSNLVFSDEVSDREFKYLDREAQNKSKYGDFLLKAISGSPEYTRMVLGFLCCGYKVSSESYIIALLEPTDASLGGGTGKGFFCTILRGWTGVLVTDGHAVKKDINQILQNWNGEPLVFLDELPKWVNLSDLKHIVSDDSQLKKLYENLKNVPVEDMPKFILSGQFGLNTEDDGGVKRRIRMLSFGGYFHGDDAIRKEYGGDCPGVWTAEDWNGFDSILADSIKDYLGARKLEIVQDLGLLLKGFDARFSGGESYLRDAIDEIIDDWLRLGYVGVDDIWDWYEAICKKYGIPAYERIKGAKRLHGALKEYGEKMELYSYEHMGDKKIHNQRVVKIKMLKQADG